MCGQRKNFFDFILSIRKAWGKCAKSENAGQKTRQAVHDGTIMRNGKQGKCINTCSAAACWGSPKPR